MRLHTLRYPLSLALLALASCSTTPTTGAPDGGSDAGPSDAGSDAGDAGPRRSPTTRALLATSTRNLLADPFVTSDTSLGHFVGVLLPMMGTQAKSVTPVRSYVSQAPAGVAAPVAVLAALAALDPAATSAQIIAPFPGGSDPFNAQIWVSAGDSKGKPVAWDMGGKGLTVSLLPNDVPTQTYPLAADGSAPVVLAGRQWVKLTLASPVPMPQGGWFSIAVTDASTSFQLQAPEVTPAAATGPVPPPRGEVRTGRDRAALGAYVEITRRAP